MAIFNSYVSLTEGNPLVGGDWNHGNFVVDFPGTVGKNHLKWRTPGFFRGVAKNHQSAWWFGTWISFFHISWMFRSHVQYSFPHEITGWWFWATTLKNHGVSSSVGMMTFPTEWKVIKFHGSKPPTRGLYQVISQHYPSLWGFEGSVHYVQLTISHRIHGAGIYANMTGVYWW